MSEDNTLYIDRDRLDVMWEEQPILMQEYGEKQADARLVLDEAKTDLEVVRAELDKLIRGNPDRFGIDKLTEKQVEVAIAIHPKNIKAQAKLRGAQHAVNVLGAMCNALDHRKKALENIVSLFGMSYFSDPRTKTKESSEALSTERKRRLRTAKKK